MHLSEGGSAARQRGSWLRLQLETTAPLRTIVVSPNRFNSALTIVSSVDQTHFGRERQGRGTGSGRWAPCRGGRRGRDGPTAAALAASLSAGSAACAMQRSVIHTASSARNCSRQTAAQMSHLRATLCRSAAARPDLSSAALHEPAPQCKHKNTLTQKHRNTQTTPHSCRPPFAVSCGADTNGGLVCNVRMNASAPARRHRRIRLRLHR